ncbi:MAG: hypothetical protein FJ102_09975 [Deltaproteobacteria bacterium]|nr:hypothetical protein [Deltaproteobacteria bacterium]
MIPWYALACCDCPPGDAPDLVDPAAVHLLVGSTPDTPEGPALEELDADFGSIFALSFGDGSGGGRRLPPGRRQHGVRPHLAAPGSR